MRRRVLLTIATFGLMLVQVSYISFGAKGAVSQKVDGSQPQSKLDESLRDMRESVHRIRETALLVINDVEQRSMVVTESLLIEPIPMADDTHPIGWAQKMDDLGPARQPNKRWLDKDVGHLGELVDAITNNFPSENSAEDKQEWKQMRPVVQELQSHYNNLKALCAGPKYDNIAIGKEALYIYNTVEKLEDPWQALVKQVKQS